MSSKVLISKHDYRNRDHNGDDDSKKKMFSKQWSRYHSFCGKLWKNKKRI